MRKIACVNGASNHTGSVCAGSVTGTLIAGGNDFVKISGSLIMVEDGTMEIPTHLNSSCITSHSHSFSPDTFGQNFVKIGGKKVVLVGDSYSGDATNVSSAGSNDFVNII